MKGLFYQVKASEEEGVFVYQDRELAPPPSEYHVKLQVKACALSHINTKLMSELNIGKEFVPVGREVAGVILEIGPKVSFFRPDDEAVGILPLNYQESGLSEVLWVHENHLVPKPEKVSWVEAAGTIRDGLRAYTALHSLASLGPGKSVLVMDGASPLGALAIQLSLHRGATVITTADSEESKLYLEKLRPAVARVIDMTKGKVDLAESCLEETGGLGVDIVLDAGVRLYNEENVNAKPKQLPHKHDIITLLSVGSHWVTSEQNLQLDPPDSHLLFFKGTSLSFLNDEVWNLSNAHQGRYLHILKDVMEKLSIGIFRPQLDDPVPLYEAKVVMEMVQKNEVRKRQIVQF
ncbi:crystallin zeta like 1 L homeolog isoform X1 [Xenopus laevis]|uniref:Crystallin zeta like 1 L homeolog n=2 Tax=Xenopus laevis TaxID=8355 RepID=Q6GQK6_XENLA|nr:crystallin zeta like 1 L homeolog [Xenopus laevis]XP_018100508.1 crystallin zeta like 1 L homeolog isoform X1 [Xenopus laevis]AAH72736.1 MGC79085 protein [Xenopus laevis]OCT93806.1 hypothetical protein XELAEV_18011477mg [Xenopus laevis]